MKAISIIGFKNSGKTTLTLRLAEELERRGLRVAIAKNSHHLLDRPDTDTSRLRAPGRTVLGLTDAEAAIFWGEYRSLRDMLPLLLLREGDILLLEGGKHRHWLPRILCLREAAEADALHRGLAVACYGPVPAPGLPHFDEAGVDALATLVEAKAFALPGLDCGACGREQCLGLAQSVVRGDVGVEACVALSGLNMGSDGTVARVRINGRTLALNPFTARVLRGAVLGMLREMKGVVPGHVELELDF